MNNPVISQFANHSRAFLLKILLIFLLGFYAGNTQAQQFPVQATTVITPPYSIYLSDYTSPESNSLQLILSLRDLDRPQYRAKLRLTIEGQGITIQTRPGYTPAPIILQGGVPETLTGFDIRGYFNPDNLVFTGISRNEFIQSGKLPEGFYTFTIEVIDYTRNVVVSNPAMANAWLILNDPPLINLPFNGEKVRATDPQNILFSWTPRHTASPNAAFNTEYEFTLVELWPKGRNPNDAILASNPIFVRTTSISSLNYGITEPILIPGRQYAFRVRAYDIGGRDLFKNTGYSEVFVFQFGDECLSPTNLEAESLDPNRIELNWEGQEIHTEYDIRYRVEGSKDWFFINTFSNKQIVPELEGNTTYEYQIRGKCNSIIGPYTTSATVTTPEIEEEAFICGSDIPEIILDTNPFNGTLNAGDEIQTADFKITLKEIEANSDGTYKGTGIAQVPYLELASIRVKFDAIRVNTEYRVYEGNITSVYDENSRFILDADLTGDEMNQDEDDPDDDGGSGDDEEDPDGSGDTGDGGTDTPVDTVTITTDQPIVDAGLDEEGNVVITYEDGTTETFEQEEDGVTEFEDSDGNTVTVDSEGNVGGLPDVDSGVIADAGSDLSTGTVNMGPVTVFFDGEPESTTTDDDGYNVYEDITVKVGLGANDPKVDSYLFVLENATISFKQHQDDQQFADVVINWNNPSDESGYNIGSVGFFDGLLNTARLTINESGDLNGTLSLTANLSEEETIDNSYVIKAKEYGDFTFTYGGRGDYEGEFDLSAINTVEVDMVKSGVTIATMTDGTFDSDGKIVGKFTVSPGLNPSYTNQFFKTTIKELDLDASYSTTNGFSFSGTAKVLLSDFTEMSGQVDLEIQYQNELASATVSAEGLSAFGMELSELNLQAAFNNSFELERLNGSFEAKHPDFSARIGVSEFLYDQNGLQKFVAAGGFNYFHSATNTTVEFIVENCTYDAAEQAITLDAVAKGEHRGKQAVFSVNGFKIDSEGTITIEEISTEASGDIVLGPIIVKMEGDLKSQGRGEEVDGEKTTIFTGKAKILLKMSAEEGVSASREVGNVDLVLRRFKNNDQNKAVIDGSLEWTGEADFADIYGISGKLKNFRIEVDREGKLSGGITLAASLAEDKSIRDMFILKKGISGEIKYNFSNEESFAGTLDLAEVSGINVIMKKGDVEIAKIENGSFNSEGVFSGTLSALENAKFSTNSFDVELKSLSVAASYDFPKNELDIESGEGAVSVSNISGIEGGIDLSLSYMSSNFQASVSSEGELKTPFGLDFKEIGSLSVTFTENFELTEISGENIKAEHTKLGEQRINFSKILIQEGELKTLEANGQITYQGFDFNLYQCTYADNSLTLDAKIALKLTDRPQEFGVRQLKFESDGNIDIGGIYGSLAYKNHFAVSFDATFGDSRFTGTFDGKIKPIGVDISGAIDIGKQDDYYFGHLKLQSRLGLTGVPLGPTGLSLTQIGGEIGYNYELEYDYATNEYTGNPSQGNYILGLTLGISDVSKTVELVGSSTVQFSNSSFNIILNGQLNITANNPMFTSNVRLDYKLPDNRLYGGITTDLKIPESTGKIFKFNSDVKFRIESDKTWEIKTDEDGITADLLSYVKFNGNFQIDGAIRNGQGLQWTVNKAHLKGSAQFQYSRNYSFSGTLLDREVISGSVDVNANFNSYVDVKLDDNGLDGKMGVDLKGSIAAQGSLLGFNSPRIEVTLDAFGEVGYANNTGYITGDAEITLDLGPVGDETIPVELDYNFNGQNNSSEVSFTKDVEDANSGNWYDDYSQIASLSKSVRDELESYVQYWDQSDLAKLNTDLRNHSAFKTKANESADYIFAWLTLKNYPTLRYNSTYLQTLIDAEERINSGGLYGNEAAKRILDGKSATQTSSILASIKKAYDDYEGLYDNYVINGSSDDIVIVKRSGSEIARYRQGTRLTSNAGDRYNYFKSLTQFTNTYDPQKRLPANVRGEAYNYYKQAKWSQFVSLLSSYDFNDGWPPADGGFNINPGQRVRKGMIFDRYQKRDYGTNSKGDPVLSGVFTSPLEGSRIPFGQRALDGNESEYKYYYTIEVLVDNIPYTVDNAEIIPWFGKPGLGKQNKWDLPIASNGYPIPWNDLAAAGYVKITVRNTPTGSIIKVIQK